MSLTFHLSARPLKDQLYPDLKDKILGKRTANKQKNKKIINCNAKSPFSHFFLASGRFNQAFNMAKIRQHVL